jgi:predicted TIM-barrel fold metal-dependent hydrolase
LKGADQLERNLLDTAEGRLKIMDDAGIDMQVLSLVSPGVQVFDDATAIKLARKVNDDLSKIVKKYPKRFAGLAALAPQDPKAAADELERAVKELGLKGASINAHTRGEYLDEKKYWVIYERAEKLKVPIYIHPRMPSPSVYKALEAYPPLSGASMGYGMEVDIHARRLIYSGVFNKYPGLKFILGHMGEAIPYWLWRLDNRWLKAATDKNMPKKPSEYFKNNFMITTSGAFSWPSLLCAYLQIGADNILFDICHRLSFRIPRRRR